MQLTLLASRQAMVVQIQAEGEAPHLVNLSRGKSIAHLALFLAKLTTFLLNSRARGFE